MARGIDYGLGKTNIDKATRIRYGIIPQNRLADWCYDEFDSNYVARCPECGEEIKAADESDAFTCSTHGEQGHDACYGDGPDSLTYEKEGYSLAVDKSGHIWVFKSPYYTRAAFCSPCAPGACYLTSPCDDGERAYCLGPDWFDESESNAALPYPIYNVADDALVTTTKADADAL